MASQGQSEEGTDAPLKINTVDIGSEMADLLKCPVCFEVITPPITLCNSGHAICSYCKENMKCCPTCRGVFTEIRCRFAENMLDKCLVRCRYREGGCQANLPGRELAVHYENCDYRPLICPRCEEIIQYYAFLDHLGNCEGMSCVIVGTQLKLIVELVDYIASQESSWSWGPYWMRAHDKNFFCFIELEKPKWWIWISLFGTEEECQNFKCSISVGNKEKDIELTYLGKVHSVRTSIEDVWESGHRLHFLDSDVKNFTQNGHIEVDVRIKQKYANTTLVHPVSTPHKRQKMDNDETTK